MEKSIILRTHQAIFHLKGTPKEERKHRICGLFGFAALSTKIWNLSQNDSPYADFYLRNIDSAIRRCEASISHLEAQLNDAMAGIAGIGVKLVESSELFSESPLEVALHFSNPYAHIAANLLQRYDQVLVKLETVTELGLLKRNTRSELVKRVTKTLRALLLSAGNFREPEILVTRKDYLQKTPAWRSSHKLLAGIPEDILKTRPPDLLFQPVVLNLDSPVLAQMNLH